ncbi:uncharacterized protein BJ171DRAFT_599952 [Polychytrium aggregatum]|uniref:uncharacterized protein n=1 Tax=Polychytrium aggregatum TaxID=110093 RepID=UPI0022FE99C7|nr:uncharacterized protein BJ171DRAFT_599952 [Polychytrium aggregatum]KAI9203728.1 hypothetical protein BJ171DRAFT_599952 [Polychytrium aggregatum]
MAALSREAIKWLQSLDLSYSIKNYKRDLANGFLVAEILSKFYPSDVSMHAFDTGTASAAKKNNWDLLERHFQKLSIPIPRELAQAVSQSKPDSAVNLLSLLFTHLYSRKRASRASSSSASPQRTISPSVLDDQLSGIEPYVRSSSPPNNPGAAPQKVAASSNRKVAGDPKCNISIINPDGANYFLGKTPNTNDAPVDVPALRDADDFGRVSVLKILFTSFGIVDPNISFNRGSIQTNALRERLSSRIESMSKDELERTLSQMGSKEKDFVLALQHSLPSDSNLIFEIILPAVASFSAMTKIFNAFVSVLCFFGAVFQVAFNRDSFQRLSQARDYNHLIHQLKASSIEKFPYVASIVQSFMNSHMSDQEKARVLLTLKSQMTQPSSTKGHATLSIPTSPQSLFLLFLCSLLYCDQNKHTNFQSQAQYTTLHLSECLTFINTHRRLYRRTNAVSGSIPVLLSSPCEMLEISAALLIMAALIRHGIQISDELLTELIDESDSSGLKSCLASPHCPTHFLKAWMRFVTSVLESRQFDSPVMAGARSAIASFLRWAPDEVLRDTLVVLSPLLLHHPQLCTPFVRTFINLKSELQNQLLKNGPSSVSFELPFMARQKFPSILHTWYTFGVAAGVTNTVISETPSALSAAQLQILGSCLIQVNFMSESELGEQQQQQLLPNKTSSTLPTLESTDQTDQTSIRKWTALFLKIHPALYVALSDPECCRMACDAIDGFSKLIGEDVLPTLPSLIATIFHIYMTGRSGTREIVTAWIHRWCQGPHTEDNNIHYPPTPEQSRVMRFTFDSISQHFPGLAVGFPELSKALSLRA